MMVAAELIRLHAFLPFRSSDLVLAGEALQRERHDLQLGGSWGGVAAQELPSWLFQEH